MRITDLLTESGGVGKVVKGINTTVDVNPGEIKRQAAKFGMAVDDESRPPIARTDGKNVAEDTETLSEFMTLENGKRVWKNPAATVLIGQLMKSKNKNLRGLVMGSDVYWWDAWDATHGDIAKQLDHKDYIDDRIDLKYNVPYEEIRLDSSEKYQDPFSHPQLKKLAQNDNILFQMPGAGWVSGEEAKTLMEKWTKKYKRSIDCGHPKGFSQRAHCAARRKRQAGGHTKSKSISESQGIPEKVLETIDELMNMGFSNEDAVDAICESLDESLRDWFREKWVRFNPQGKIMGPCARGSSKEGKPKCLPQAKAHALGKKARAKAARRKRREDPNPERKGKAHNVATKESVCPHCGGELLDDQMLAEKRDACYYKVRRRYKVWPSAYASGALVQCRKKGAKNWGKSK